MSRKYKQRGYLDEGAPRGRSGHTEPRPAGRREDGPRGRGLGAPTATTFRCARCGEAQGDVEPGLEAVCEACGTDLHTCTHCAHFDTSAPLECRQPIRERIARKDRRNECGFFERKLTQGFAAETDTPSDARAAFDDLFDL